MKYVIIDTLEDLKATMHYFRSKKNPTGFDLETENVTSPRKGNLRLAQFSDGNKTIILDVRKFLANENRVDTIGQRDKNFDIFLPIKEFLEDPTVVKVIHYAQFECEWMRVYADADPVAVFDTFLASKAINYNLSRHSLASVANEYLKIDLDKTEQKSDWTRAILLQEQYDYAALDVFYLPKLREVMFEYILEDKVQDALRLDLESIPATVDMKVHGLKVNPTLYKNEIVNLEGLYGKASEDLQSALRVTKPNMGIQQSMFGIPELNYSDVLLSSHQQMLEALKSLGLPVFAKTEYEEIARHKKQGKPFAIGTGKTALEGMMGSYPVIKQLIDFRGVEKMLSSFGYNLLEHLEQDENGDWRVHAHFNIVGAPTGRFSSSGPNTQQIPDKKLEVGVEEYDLGFRTAFDFPEGYVGINADYSQIELRILAEFSNCPIFTEAFLSEKDLHALTAAALFDAEYEYCMDENHPYYKKYRKPTKSVNFGIAYGIGPQRLAAQLRITVEEATEILDKHKNAHPVLWSYLDSAYYATIRTLQARTASGRLQKFQRPNVDEKGMPLKSEVSAIGRNGKNMPIQGCLAGETRILVKGEGYIKIGEAEKTKCEVWDSNDNVAAFVTVSGKKTLTNVRFEGNHSIQCSPEHKFWAIKKGEDWEWVEARNLTHSHKVMVTNKTPNFDFLPKDKFTILNKLTSAEVGLLAGTIYARGAVLDKSVVILFPETERTLKAKLQEIFSKLDLTYNKESLYDSKTKIKTKYWIGSEELARDLRLLDSKEGFSELFWTSKPLIENFLKVVFNFAFFTKEDIQIKGSSQLLDDIQQALYLFGVSSNRIKGLLKNILFISKRDAYRFILNVGIIEESKVLKIADFNKLKNFRMPNKYNQSKLQVAEVIVTDKEVEMFDVADSDTSQFVANGLVTHNTSADILKRALKLLHDSLKGKDAWIVNIVHDEITVECKEDIAEEVRVILETCMRNAAKEYLTKIPVKVDAKIIQNWGDK